jgi:hypothetical protein
VSGSTHKAIRIFNLSSVLLSLLVLTSSCGGTPSSTDTAAPSPLPEALNTIAPQTGESVAAQQIPPQTPLASIQLPADAQAAPPAPTSSKQQDCPKLAHQLYQITQAPDPITLAQQTGLRVKETKLQVLLIVNRADVQFAPIFGVEVGSRSGTQVQAFVPIDQLCALANTDEVVAIRLPAQAMPE